MIRRILLAAAALVAALATVTNWAVLLIAVALYGSTVIMATAGGSSRRTGDADQTGAAIVLSVATGIVVLHADADTASLWIVATLLAVLHGFHLFRHVLRVLVFRRWRGAADWRNVDVSAPVPRRVLPVAGPTLATIPVWIAAPICAILDASPLVYLLLGILSLVLMALTLAPISRALVHNLRMPSEQSRLAALTTALRARRPEVLVHFNARARSDYAINDWMAVLTALNQTHPVVILTVDREPWHFETIAGDSIPIVHLNGAEAIEHFVEQVPSLVLALYPRNTSPNKNLLRVPGLYDVYLGHGESDKPEAANPAVRAFDEVWIAGEAAHRRYLEAGIGVKAESLRTTGRPQLTELLELAETPRPNQTRSVVYAPTWEGYYAEDGYGSIEAMGVAVINALLDRADLRVTYLPHPALGSLNRGFAEANDRIVRRLRRAGHSSVVGGSLAERFAVLAGADLLVTDVSSDVVDFLALNRPYIVLDPVGDRASAFLAANPSAGAGTVIDPTSIPLLGETIERALASTGPDAARVELARSYLGPLDSPPLEVWLAEVDRCLGLIRATRPERELPSITEVGQ
jgi:CDP-Glycerol:Poly(glycerophosphate) glycerophosphotransferase